MEEAGDNARMLLNLRKRMATIRVFDPACGSGNFLVIAYKEMRAIEAEIIAQRVIVRNGTSSSKKKNPVENKLSEDPNAGKLGIDLTFKSLDDFSPDAVARQVKPLKELLDLRTKLSDLRGTLQGNDKLDDILQETLGDEDKMKKLQRGARPDGGSNG